MAVEHTEAAFEAMRAGVARGREDAAEARAGAEAFAAAERAWALARSRGVERELEEVARRASSRCEALERARVEGEEARGFAAFLRRDAAAERPGDADVELAVLARGVLLLRDDVETLEARLREMESARTRVETLTFGVLHARAFRRYEAERGDEDAASLVAARTPALMAQYVTWLKNITVESRDARLLAPARAALVRFVSAGAELLDAGDVAGAANVLCAVFNALTVVISVEGKLNIDDAATLRERAIESGEAVAAAFARTADEDWTEARFGVHVARLALERLLREIG